MSTASRFRIVAVACLFLAAAPTQSFATPVTFNALSGNLAASATFDTSGNDLIVTLTNTSPDDVLVPADILTALFFDITNAVALSKSSAALAPGSIVLFGGTDPLNVVGGEWAYRTGLVGAPHSSSYGIGSAGFGLFGDADRFPGSNLQGPNAPNGLQYGITSMGDDPGTGNGPVTGPNALIQNSVIFTFGGLPAGFDPSSSISNVSFQYGTSLAEPNIETPEPRTFLLLVMGLALTIHRRHA